MIFLALLTPACGAHAEVRWNVSKREEGGARLVLATARNDGTAPVSLGRYKLAEEELKVGPDAVAVLDRAVRPCSMARTVWQ